MPLGNHEDTDAAYAEFNKHIKEETQKALAQYDGMVDNPEVASVACVDKLSTNLDWNPPGGGIFLWMEGFLNEWMRVKKSGTLAVHENCGYMRVILGISSLREQKIKIEEFKKKVRLLNKELGTSFEVVVDTDGSAKDFMTK